MNGTQPRDCDHASSGEWPLSGEPAMKSLRHVTQSVRPGDQRSNTSTLGDEFEDTCTRSDDSDDFGTEKTYVPSALAPAFREPVSGEPLPAPPGLAGRFLP